MIPEPSVLSAALGVNGAASVRAGRSRNAPLLSSTVRDGTGLRMSKPRVTVPGARPPYGSPSVRPRRHIRDTSLISLAARVPRAVEGVVDGETGLSGEPTDRRA